MAYKDPDKKRVANREWMRAHPEVWQRAAAKRRAKALSSPEEYAKHIAGRREDAARWRATGGRRVSEDRTRAKDPKRVWPRLALAAIKWRAKRKNIECSLTLEQMRTLKLPDACPYLGIALIYGGTGRGKFGPHANSPSVDRIDPSSGYTIGNIEIISNRANALKGNGTAEEHEMIASRLRKFERLRAKDPLLRS